MQPMERDGCYLAKSRIPTDCLFISDVIVRDQCFLAIAESHAKTYRDCDGLYLQYQPICYARITYQDKKNQMACEDLQPEFKSYCYFYYADMKSGGRLSSCETIPPQYKQECLRNFFTKASVKSEADCKGTFGGRYYEDCASYAGSKTNPVAIVLTFIQSALAFLTSGTVVMVISVIVFLSLALFMIKVLLRIFEKERKNS
ncbi:MAG: hypothetical protein V1909_02200 [Candidatus Micrarchaeota archaeon]